MNIKGKHIYFLGIGGIGMSALARLLHAEGNRISGYDLTSTPLTQALENEGMEISYSDDINTIKNKPDLIIYTPAIPKENQIFQYFISSQIPMLKRAAMLGQITENYYTIAVAGTHGKTTITSLIAHILKYNKKPITAFVGGICKNYHSNLILSTPTKIIVVEADEYDRSFLTLSPDIAVISSMDADHLDIYGSKEYLEESFNLFAKKIKKGGVLYSYNQLPVKTDLEVNHYEYSVDEAAQVDATNIEVFEGRTRFSLNILNHKTLQINSFLPGKHNAANIAVAAAVCNYIGVSAQGIEDAIKVYKGVERRFDIQLITEKHIYIDDYAHHPEEIKATIKAIRMLYPNKKLTAIFQPHLFSRTRDFADEFAEALSMADQLLLMDIYPAREKPIPGITSKWLLNKVKINNKKLTDFESVIKDITDSETEIILTIGAGSIDRIVEPIKKALS